MHTEIPKPPPEYFKEKSLTMFTDIRGECYLNNMRNKKYPMKKPSLSKKQQ